MSSSYLSRIQHNFAFAEIGKTYRTESQKQHCTTLQSTPQDKVQVLKTNFFFFLFFGINSFNCWTQF